MGRDGGLLLGFACGGVSGCLAGHTAPRATPGAAVMNTSPGVQQYSAPGIDQQQPGAPYGPNVSVHAQLTNLTFTEQHSASLATFDTVPKSGITRGHVETAPRVAI